MLLPAEDFAPDYYVITHTHFDHLDYDTILVVKSGRRDLIFGPTSCLDVLAEMGVEKSRCHRWIGDALWGPAGAGGGGHR
ncbi:MAG: hypothetical protein ACLTYN_04860 [Dysosmobacter welbionis]